MDAEQELAALDTQLGACFKDSGHYRAKEHNLQVPVIPTRERRHELAVWIGQ